MLLFCSFTQVISHMSYVFIDGITINNNNSYNGVYYRTSEISNGYSVYKKLDGTLLCIEHSEATTNWQLKDLSSKGRNWCSAYVQGGCALEDCTSREWCVHSGVTHINQPSVKMLTGAEAERAVSDPCIGAARHSATA
jgi:hypothetical protein